MNRAERKGIIHGLVGLTTLVQGIGNERDRDRLMGLVRLMFEHVNYGQCISCRHANSGVCSVCYRNDKYEEDKRGDE